MSAATQQAWDDLVKRYRLRRPGRDEQGHFVRDDECLKVAGVLQQAAMEAQVIALHRPGDGHAVVQAAEEAMSLLRLARAWLMEADAAPKTRGFPEEDVPRETSG